MLKLTHKVVEATKPKEKDFTVWDSDIKGFGCRILPTGYKTYVFFYRLPRDKKVHYLKIGVHGSIDCDVAREVAKNWSNDLVRGIDPKKQIEAVVKEKKQSAVTMEKLAKIHMEYSKRNNKQKTQKENQRQWDKYILPELGALPISAVTSVVLQRFLDKFQPNEKHQMKVQSNRLIALLSKAFALAEERGLISGVNPCAKLRKFKEKAKETYLTEEQIRKTLEFLDCAETKDHHSVYGIAAIKMLLYVGARKNEVLRLKWYNVHLEDRYFALSDTKTGGWYVPLNEAAVEILKAVPRLPDCEYVFCGKQPQEHLKDLRRIMDKIRDLLGLEELRVHDLRHTFASLAIKKGLNLYELGKLLGHRSMQTTNRYAHLSRDDLLRLSDQVGKAFLQ